MNRRQFLSGCGATAVVAGSSALCGVQAKPAVVMPPGAVSFDRFRTACTACGLCIASCPQGVLVPAGVFDYGLSGTLMPRLDFTRGGCDPTCQRCAEVCPAQALLKYSAEERPSVKMGLAVWNRQLCQTTTGQTCTLCHDRCPRQAIRLERDAPDGVAHPVVDPEACVGCGQCENYCPAEGRAIRVRPF